MTVEQRKKLASVILMADLYPSAFVHENTAAAVYYALNSQFSNPEHDENILFINIGDLGTKMSLLRVWNSLDKPEKPDAGFHPEVSGLVDKFYPEFSGHNLGYCFSNLALNKHHKNDEP